MYRRVRIRQLLVEPSKLFRLALQGLWRRVYYIELFTLKPVDRYRTISRDLIGSYIRREDYQPFPDGKGATTRPTDIVANSITLDS